LILVEETIPHYLSKEQMIARSSTAAAAKILAKSALFKDFAHLSPPAT
jgi:hypothetical protein